MFRVPLKVDVTILSEDEYNKHISGGTMAELHKSSASDKTKTLKGMAEQTKDKIYVKTLIQKLILTK